VRALASNPGRVVQLVQWSLRAGAATGTPLLEAALDAFVAGSPPKSSVVAFDETAEHVVCAAGRRFAPIYAVSVLGQPPPLHCASATHSERPRQTATGRWIGSVGAHEAPITAVDWAPSASACLTASPDRLVRLYQLQPAASEL
jgi:hypothetical protein